MNHPQDTESPPAPTEPRRVTGKRVVWIGLLVVALFTTFVIVRIVQTTEPGPDPSEIPKRPEARTP